MLFAVNLQVEIDTASMDTANEESEDLKKWLKKFQTRLLE